MVEDLGRSLPQGPAGLVAESIDRLVACDLRARPIFEPMYRAARAAQGGPLCALAAGRLAGALEGRRGGAVLFLTGFASPLLGVGEQDGPVGAAYLGRCLEQAFGAVPVVVTDAHQVELCTQTLRGGGFNVIALPRALEAGRRGKGKAAAVVACPAEDGEARTFASGLLAETGAAAVVAIERPGANRFGIPHSFTAVEIGEATAPTDHLLRAARQAGLATVAVGDAGNELGCGLIHAEAERILGERQRCPACGGTVAAAEAADVLVMAAVSNWGAYGIAAGLAARLGDRRLMPDRAVLEWTLRAAALAGGRNGISDWTDPGSDGYPIEVELGLLAMLGELAACGSA